MNTITGTILFFFLVWLQSPKEDCKHNNLVNNDWQKKIKDLGYRKDSSRVFINKSYKENNTTPDEGDDRKQQNIYYFSAGSKRVVLVENAFDNSCNAKRSFDRAIKYYRSNEPETDNNFASVAGLLQGDNYFEIKGKQKVDTLVKRFMHDFKEALLKNRAEPNTAFIRDSNGVTVE